MALTSTHDGQGNVTLYGGTATHDGLGNVTLYVAQDGASKVLARDEITLSTSATSAELAGTNEQLTVLAQQVAQMITPEQLQIVISELAAAGAAKVVTETGYTFDKDGMTVSKSGSDIKTQVTEDGLHVYRSEDEVLKADNQGVKAEDLHATTYLVIGDYSRFENWEDPEGEKRTACFWVGNVQEKTPEDMETETDVETDTEGDEE